MSRLTEWALLTAILAAPVAIQASQSPKGVAEAIESQPLDQALDSWARQTGLQVIYGADLIAGRQSRGARAGASPREALEQIIEGSGLVITWLNERTASIGVPTGDPRSPAVLRLSQADSTVDEPKDPADEKLEEVTVTGTRIQLFSSRAITSGVVGDKDPLDIPFSVSSYSSELAKLQGAYTPAEILKNDPSVQNTGLYVYQNHLVIRGVQARAGGVRRDGLHANDEGDLPIEAFDRLEVVKGVAGFLYGFAEPGGIQNYVTKRPTRDSFATLELQGRSGSGRYLHVDSGGPLGDGRFGYRANAAYEDQGDFSHSGDMRRTMGSLALDAKASDALLIRFDASHQSRELSSQDGLPLTTEGLEPPEYDPRKAFAPSWLRSKFISSSVALRAEYHLSEDWQILAQAGHDWSRFDPSFAYLTSLEPNGDLTGELSADPRWFYTRNRWTNGQLLALGKLSTGAVRHDLVFGVFRRKGSYLEYYPNTSSPTLEFDGNLFGEINFPQRPTGASYEYALGYELEQSETHVFAADTLSIGERLQILAGARYTALADSDVEAEAEVGKVKKTSPSGAVIYKVTDNARIYGSYARSLQQSYRGPCADRPEVSGACDNQPPIQAKQIEVGAKARIGGVLDLSIAAFRIEMPFDYVDEERLVYGRFGNQVNQGVEFLAVGNVRPNLAVVAGVGYLDAELVRNQDPTLNGNRIPGVPNWNANLFADYGVRGVPGLSLTGGVYWGGSRMFDVRNEIPVAGYTRVDLGAQYHMPMVLRGLTLRANVDNVLDKFYWEGLTLGSYTPAFGRSYSLTAELQLQ